MNKSEEQLLEVFPNYVRLFSQLDTEYRRTPAWRFFRQMSILNRMHKINRKYEKWLEERLEQAK